MQTRIERLFQAQATIRRHYQVGPIDAAIDEFHSVVAPAIHAVDPRVARCAMGIAKSLVHMVDNDPDVIAYLASAK